MSEVPCTCGARARWNADPTTEQRHSSDCAFTLALRAALGILIAPEPGAVTCGAPLPCTTEQHHSSQEHERWKSVRAERGEHQHYTRPDNLPSAEQMAEWQRLKR